MINEKAVILDVLLSLCGHLTECLLHNLEEQSAKFALLAQTPPTLLEWMRKQVMMHFSSKSLLLTCRAVEVSTILLLVAHKFVFLTSKIICASRLPSLLTTQQSRGS